MLSADAQYEALAVIRNQEVTSRWTISSFFSILETGLMYLALTTLKEELFLFVPACAVGVIISVLWRRLLKKIDAWLKIWNSCLAEIERSGNGCGVFSRPGFEAQAKVPRSMGSDKVLLWLAYIFTIAWLALMVGIPILTYSKV